MQANSRGSVQRWSHQSQVLRDNPLGDPTGRDVHVYLPPGHDEGNCQGLPLILLLAGFAGRSRGMLGDNLYAPAIDDRMDTLIAEGCPKAVLALPDCSTALGGSQYLNSPATGQYQDYLVQEIIPWLKDRLGLHRVGVAGKSSGGYGALRLGMLAPDSIDAVACHSGDCYFEYGYIPDIPKAAVTLKQAGSIQNFLQDFHKQEKKSSSQIMALHILCNAACYSPSPQGPYGLDQGYDLPFDLDTGAYRPEVFERWLQQDPYRMVADHTEALQSLRLLFVDVGAHDEFNLQLGARLLHQRLQDLGIAHQYQEFADGHFSTSYRYGASLPLLCQALTGD